MRRIFGYKIHHYNHYNSPRVTWNMNDILRNIGLINDPWFDEYYL